MYQNDAEYIFQQKLLPKVNIWRRSARLSRISRHSYRYGVRDSLVSALRALAEAINERGVVHSPSIHIPAGVLTVKRSHWQEFAYRRGISGSDKESARRMAFQRAVEDLQLKNKIGVWDGEVWLTAKD